MSNEWGRGDVFSKYIDPANDTAQYEQYHDEHRVEIGREKSPMDQAMTFMWKLIFLGGTFIIFMFVVAAVLGMIFGMISGIAGTL